MPIKHSKQNWNVGQTVKVGFLSLKVIGFTPTPGDYLPDTYTLASSKGIRYLFTPHHGIERIEGLHIEQAASVSNTFRPLPVAITSGGRYFRTGE